VGGYFVYDRFLPEWLPEQFGKDTDTPEVVATNTPKPPKTERPVEATLTEEAPIETPTEQVLPPLETITPTLETPVLPVVTISATVTTSVTVTPETAAVPPIGQVILENDFSTDPMDNWRTWGKNYPRPEPMPSDNPRFNLTAVDPGLAGATSRQDIAFISGVEVLFRAQLDPEGWQHPLIFDWDPVARGRGPENRYPGVIRLVISKDELVVQNGENLICRIESIGRDNHTYRIKVIGSGEAEFWLDDQATPSCTLNNLDLKPSGGKISFTGMGWLLYVRVTIP
jgi:hypothetical protein